MVNLSVLAVRCVTVAASVVVTLWITDLPNAAADYIAVGSADAPSGPGMGHVSISTEPGKIIVVDIVGRYDALNAAGPLSNRCDVALGNNLDYRSVVLDDTGSGTARFGPVDFDTIVVSGKCGTHLPLAPDKSSNLNLTAAFDPVCPECSSRGAKLVLDGGAPLVGPQYPRPEPIDQAQPKEANCADQLSNSYNRLPPGTEAALEQIRAIPKNASTFGLATCALVEAASSDDLLEDQDAFQAVCRTLENALDPLGVGAAKDFFCGTPVG